MALLRDVQTRSERWAKSIDRHCGLMLGSTDPDDVLVAAWIVLDRHGDRVARAESPWGYLFRSVRNLCADEHAASARLSQVSRRLLRAGGLPAVVRVGAEEWLLDHGTGGCDVLATGRELIELAVELLVGAGGDRAFWTEAVFRAVEVMDDARRSYEEFALRRDPVMREELGLLANELSALAALLLGPRRGDRASQSLLLALSRDPEATLEDVRGACSRVRQLLARPHALGAAATPDA